MGKDILKAHGLELAEFFLGHSFDGVVLAEGDGAIFYASDEAMRTLGRSKEQLISSSVEELFPKIKQKIKERKSGPVFSEMTLRLANETKVDLRVMCCSKSDLMVIVMRDQSMMEDLENTRNLLDEAEDMAHMGSFELNLKTGDSKRSKGIKRLLGLDPMGSESGFKDYLDRLHPDDHAKIQEAMSQFRAGVDYQEWEH